MTANIESPIFGRNRQYNTGRNGPDRAAWRIALGYLVVGALWILLSDRLLVEFIKDLRWRGEVELIKGWLFVGVTAWALFVLLRARLRRAQRQEEQLRLFVEHAPVALAMLDRELRYVTASRRWRLDYALGDQPLAGRRHTEFFPQLSERWREAHRRALAGESLHEEADAVTRPDGVVQWRRWEMRPWTDESGAIGGIVLFTENVTERKLAEDALFESQVRVRLALESGRVGTWTWDVASGRLDVDEGVARLFAQDRAHFVCGGLEFFRNCIHPDDRSRFAVASGGDWFCEYRIVRPDGRILHLADRGRCERDAAGRVRRMFGACVDVSDMKRIEQALKDSEARFREVVETIRDVFWVTDIATRKLLYISPAFEAVWGRPCGELHANDGNWAEWVHPEDQERVQKALLARQLDAIYDEAFRIVRPDKTVRWIRAHTFPARDASGTPVRIIGIAEDVTERQQLEEQFLRAQRLEAIGTLASGVAHDLNNILAPMFMLGPLIKPKLTETEDIDMLNIVDQSAKRGAEVVRQLLTFSRGMKGERGPLQVGHLVKEMTTIMRETFPREIGIASQVPGGLWPVVGDATQLHQVVMNLCVNARDAMPEGGKLQISARNAELGPDAVRHHKNAAPGRYVVLSVTDTGEGIPPESRARIFEPFFTTKEIGKGTGLGLSTVLGIVGSHGGFITFESEVGAGTTFHVHLPAATEWAAPMPALAEPAVAPAKGELILIVDDEPAVRLAMQLVLERRGYRVLPAANGRDALARFFPHRAEIRAVVTDLMMPEMGGIALIHALRDLAPTLPIVAATGLESAEKRAVLVALGIMEILPKPYATTDLLETVQRVLPPPPQFLPGDATKCAGCSANGAESVAGQSGTL